MTLRLKIARETKEFSNFPIHSKNFCLPSSTLNSNTFSVLGIDADTASRIPDNQETGFQPTINILYQMLHTTDYNRTKVNLNSNFKSDDVTVKECCSTEVTTEGIHKGAKVVNETVLNDKKNRQRRLVNVDRTVYGSLSEVRVEVTTVTSVISPPPLMERRRKPGETGSSAPLLNYIFDTYPNTHQHWNGK